MTTHLRAPAAPLVTAHAKRVVADTGVLNNPYFRTLVDGSMPLEKFRTTPRLVLHREGSPPTWRRPPVATPGAFAWRVVP
ncbi:hypothetical protein ACIQCJ_11435 [Streptomyces sp. NPDC093221]|uniref:hypothetical protein n=1 Tax=Streptomyces sp. NPDC093221 TaxID=3366032 RepID=UPI0037FF05F7